MTVKTVKTKRIPPDGGWGWVVLMSALTVNLLIPGMVKSFGVLFVEFHTVFKSSTTAASWMPALCYFLYNSLGPLSSILSNKYSYKTVTLIGGAFASGGMMLSYFANSVPHLYVTYGVMVGIGAGLTYPPTVYIVTAYFEKWRGFANGLCVSGSAIGTILLPPFLQYLLDCFGYRGAVLIMGAITLNTLVCGLLYHPVEEHMIEVPIDEGIDNEALSLDEPALNEKPEVDSTKIDTDKAEEKRSSVEKKRPSENEKNVNEIRNRKNEALKETRRKSKIAKIDEILPCEIYRKISEVECPNLKSNEESNSSVIKSEEEEEEEEEKKEKEEKDKRECCKNLNDGEEKQQSRRRVNEKEKYENNQLETYGDWKDAGCDNGGDSKAVVLYEADQKLPEKKSSIAKQEEISASSATRFFDLSVLKDPIYLVILISNTTSAISNVNFMILLPSYAIAEGFDKHMSALLLSIVSALDVVGRIAGASLSDIDFVPKYYYFVVGLGTSGIALALLPMATSYHALSFFCALFGLSSGMYIGITTVILADMLGTEKLSSSYGISLFVNGVLQLVGPPVCGIIFESIESYKPIFLAFGIILILGTALWAVVPWLKRSHKKDVEVV